MYKLKSPSNIEDGTLLETVLKNRDIKNYNDFLNPSSDDLIHYSKLENINKAVETFLNIMKRESSELAILVDSDP